MSLVLIGARGAGKSTAGRVLAGRVGAPFVDLDAVIEAGAGTSVARIFADRGEAWFRELEHRALLSQPLDQVAVIATGGGVVLRAENREHLAQARAVVWLRVSAETAVARTRDEEGRPALTSLAPLEEARAIARHRAGLYEQVASHHVNSDDRSLDEVCDELEHIWHAL
jgi:shikimate kinase